MNTSTNYIAEDPIWIDGNGNVVIPEQFWWGTYAVSQVGKSQIRSQSHLDKRNTNIGRQTNDTGTCGPDQVLACPITDALPCCDKKTPICCPAPSSACCATGWLCQGLKTCCQVGYVGCGEACCSPNQTCCGTLCCESGISCIQGQCVAGINLTTTSSMDPSVASVVASLTSALVQASSEVLTANAEQNKSLLAAVIGCSVLGTAIVIGSAAFILNKQRLKKKARFQQASHPHASREGSGGTTATAGSPMREQNAPYNNPMVTYGHNVSHPTIPHTRTDSTQNMLAPPVPPTTTATTPPPVYFPSTRGQWDNPFKSSRIFGFRLMN